jgi:AmiR/NasT family two-component response regulator
VVALLGSEAPGRIAWAIEQGAGAIIAKPVAASAVYPALVMAASIHQERKSSAERQRYLEERVRLRPLVHAAVEKLMAAHRVDEERAYAILRDCAMRRRLPMEQIAAFIIGGAEPLPEAG